MREIGVVKWFDSNKGHGHISRINHHSDMFVHHSQVKCAATSLKEGTFVTYLYQEEPRVQAIFVLLFKDDNDEQVLRKAFLSKRNGLWLRGLKEYVSILTNPDDEIIEALLYRLKAERNSKELIKFIPDILLTNNEDFRIFLPILKRISIAVTLYEKAINDEIKSKELRELEMLLKPFAHKNCDKWDMVPVDLLSNTRIRAVAPSDLLFKFYINSLHVDSNEVVVKEFIDFLKQYRKYLVEIPKDLLKQYSRLFQLVPIDVQLEVLWDDIESEWQGLSRDAKILAIYKSAKENTKYDVITKKLSNQQETDSLIRSLLLILTNKYNKDHFTKKGISIFDIAHGNILNFVIEESEHSNIIKNLTRTLPSCNHKETHFCEGRKFLTNEGASAFDYSGNELAFCPRKGGSCIVNDQSARIYSNTSQHWKNWTLAELMKVCDVIPELDLRLNDVYVLKLSGWVNRLIEIKERMRCSVCNDTMVADIRYAKNLAKYCSTVAKCRIGHETAYLTHCWACQEIIDSRESKHREEGYHICIHCGSGPQYNSTFKPGDICPKCASKNMVSLHNGTLQCAQSHCRHTIYIQSGTRY